MLMVAPVTHAQVVVGKLLGGVAVQVGIAVAILLPTLVAAITYSGSQAMSLYGLVRMELVVLATGIFCSALTMLISARVKRAFVALGVSFTVLFLIFIFLPTIVSSVGGSSEFTNMLFAWHPGWALAAVDTHSLYNSYSSGYEQNDTGLAGLVTIVFLLAFAAIFTAWTVHTVAFADNEVRFLPGSKKSERKKRDVS